MKIEINGRHIGDQTKPFLIAEISGNHNGSIDRMLKLISLANENGADAVKIQSYTPDSLTIDSNRDDFKITDGLWAGHTLYELYEIAHTPFEWHEDIFSFCKEQKITLFSSPFDTKAVDLLESLDAPAFKIASFEIQDLELIKAAANVGKPMIISTGMAALNDIACAVDACHSVGNKQIILLKCTSSYPAPAHDTNLATINHLKDCFDTEVGISDHTLGNAVSVAAVALGASLIERHFIDQRSAGGVDSEFSLEPKELLQLRVDVDNAFIATGSVSYAPQESEKTNMKFRRSLYYVSDVKKGSIIRDEHIRTIRPGFGESPFKKGYFTGRIAAKDIKAGDRVTSDSVAS